MSNLITCQALTKAFGAQTLFEDVDLIINSGDRIGLIGPNGSGKSTLLRILCGREDTDTGTILMSKHTRTGYLAQEDVFEEEMSITENLLASINKEDMEEVEKHNRVAEVLSRAEFSNVDQPVKVLSGGWRKRLAICRALLPAPDLLVLDEPTNHLDIQGILWLEKLLVSGAAGPSAFLFVSHDRQFLQNCANRVVELAPVFPQGSFQVQGSYETYLEKRQEWLDNQLEQENRLANKLRRETEWLNRGPKARTSKARYRIEEAYRLKEEFSRVKGRNRALADVDIEFDATGRKTKKLLEAKNLTKSYDNKLLFAELDVVLSPGSKVGLLGHNGCGKSTLMQVLAAGENAASILDDGTVRTADGVSIVSFDQKRATLDHQVTLRRALAPEGDSVVFQGRSLHVISWAKRFLFRPDQLETPVGELSGGEQARILIASLMRQSADILLLDEPTNDLDISSLQVLEESLMDFAGALVLVTHDRYLLERVCDSVLGFDGGGGVRHYADYRQWLKDLKKDEKEEIQKESKSQTPGKGESVKTGGGKKPGKLSYLDQREYDQIEGKIEKAEAMQAELEQSLADPETAVDPEQLESCWQELEKVKAEVEALYERWDELEDKRKAG